MAEYVVDETIEKLEESTTEEVVDDIPETEEPASEEAPLEESIPEESAPEESVSEESIPGESIPEEFVLEESASGESVSEAGVSDVGASASVPGTPSGESILAPTGTASTDTGSGTSSVVYDNSELVEFLTSIQETQTLQLESSQRIEMQLEAVISILLIFVVVGLLHYIYRFLRLFF